MKLTMKSAFHALSAPLLFVTLTTISMDLDRPESTSIKIDQFNAIMQRSADETYKLNIPIAVSPKKYAIGVGDKESIQILNDANIPTKPHEPLIPINVFIPNPKKNPTDPQNFTNWTEKPFNLGSGLIKIAQNQINQEREELTQILGAPNRDNNHLWMQWGARRTELLQNATEKSKALSSVRFPAAFPVKYFSSDSLKINLFTHCDLTLKNKCNDENLEKAMLKFETQPHTFTIIDPSIYQGVNPAEIRTHLEGLAFDTCNELLHEGILTQIAPVAQSRATLEIFNPNILRHQDDNITHGPNGHTKEEFSEMQLKHTFPKGGAFNHVRDRQTTGKKLNCLTHK